MERRSAVFAAVLALVAVVLVIGMNAQTASAEGPREAGRVASKDMVFWLHYDPTSPTVNGKATQLTFNTSQYWTESNYTIDGDKELSMDFYMVPVLAADVRVNGTVTVGTWGNYSGSNNNFQFKVTISELNSAKSENWTSATSAFDYKPASAPQYYSFQIDNFDHTFAKGSTVHLNLLVTGGNGIYKAIYIDTLTNNSRLVLPCWDYMEVSSVNTHDHQGVPKAGFETNAANTTILVRSVVNAPFGGYDVRWANLTLEGPGGTKLLDNASMAKVSGTPVSFANTYEASWNYSGYPAGRYNLTVWAVDNSGYYYCFYFLNFNYGPYAVSNTSFFFIGSPRFVNVVAMDSTGVPLVGAEVQAAVLDRVIDRNSTNLNGLTNLSMQPGAYHFKVLWQGVLVADEPVDVVGNRTESDPVNVYCRVYYPFFRAVDSHDLPLVDAAVYVHFPNDTASILPFRTDENGEFDLSQAPRGLYELSVVWGSLEVNRTLVPVNGNETYILHCSVFYLTVRAVDPHGSPVLNAQMVVIDNSTGIVADSKLSDLEGCATFRLPWHFYDLRVFWYEAVIYEGWHEPVLSDREITLTCGIYYLTVQAVDSRDVPLENALIVVGISANGKVMDSKLSGAGGEAEIRLPTGGYDIDVYWQDLLVLHETDIQVTEDGTHVARCAVHYLTILVVDSHGLPLEGAQVQVSSVVTGKLLDVQTSGPSGAMTSRLPASELSMRATWQDVVVNTTPSYILTSDGELRMEASVYYLTVSALDDRGLPIQSARVQASLASSGKLLDVQVTGYDGLAISRLPAAELSFSAYWQDVLVNETPSYLLGADGTLVLQCRVYYLDILAIDSRDLPLDDAYVRVSHVLGRLVESPRTDETGRTVVRVPVGQVNVSITWMNVPVAEISAHDVSSSHLLTVRCSVFYTNVTITDSLDNTVSNAQVTFALLLSGKKLDSRITGPAGETVFRLPAELYNVTVVWQDQLVSPITDHRVSSDGSLTVKCMIYYLTVRPVDSRGKVLENATVVFRQDLTGNILDTRITGPGGLVTSRLPIGLHTIWVSWKDVVVNTTEAHELTADTTLTLECRVFYLTLLPQDVLSLPLGDAEVVMWPAGRPESPTSLLTPANGTVTFRLPAQSYDLLVRWRGVEVCSRTGHALAGDAVLPLSCRVYYLTVKISDREGNSLEGVQVTVYTMKGGLVVEVAGSTSTNRSSRAAFRLPVGEYKAVAKLKTTYLLTPIDMTVSRPVSLQDSLVVKLVFNDYPVPIYTTNLFFAVLLFLMLFILAAMTVWYVIRKFGRRAAPRLPGDEKAPGAGPKAEGEGEEGRSGEEGPSGKEAVEDEELPEKEEPEDEKVPRKEGPVDEESPGKGASEDEELPGKGMEGAEKPDGKPSREPSGGPEAPDKAGPGDAAGDKGGKKVNSVEDILQSLDKM